MKDVDHLGAPGQGLPSGAEAHVTQVSAEGRASNLVATSCSGGAGREEGPPRPHHVDGYPPRVWITLAAGWLPA